jgi:Tn3 transposase DDE domain
VTRVTSTLNYFREVRLQRDVHRSQNRIEAYHQPRSAIAQFGGRKQLAGRADLDMAIGNQ